MHLAHHIEPPLVHLAIDEALLGMEFFTPSKLNDCRAKAMIVHVTECYALMLHY